MQIALDATYSLGEHLSGVGVYSREILNGLAASDFPAHWDWFYRAHRYRAARSFSKPPNVRQRFLSDTLGRRSADLFHGLNQRLPRRRFRRQIATFHDLFVLSGDYSTPEFRARFAAQARDAAAASDLIIAVSAFTASQIESYLHVPRERIRVIHHGLISRKLPSLPREKVILCVGAIQRRKNQAGLVRAFRALPPDWHLVLAGSQGYEAAETLREIEASPCRDRIRLTGYLTEAEIAGLYAKAAIFAFPSFDEGFGMPILEAMDAGVAVVAGKGSALPEVAGDAAILIDPGDDNELAAALERLSRDSDLRETMAAAGRRRSALFTWPNAVEGTLAAYRELLP